MSASTGCRLTPRERGPATDLRRRPRLHARSPPRSRARREVRIRVVSLRMIAKELLERRALLGREGVRGERGREGVVVGHGALQTKSGSVVSSRRRRGSTLQVHFSSRALALGLSIALATASCSSAREDDPAPRVGRVSSGLTQSIVYVASNRSPISLDTGSTSSTGRSSAPRPGRLRDAPMTRPASS